MLLYGVTHLRSKIVKPDLTFIIYLTADYRLLRRRAFLSDADWRTTRFLQEKIFPVFSSFISRIPSLDNQDWKQGAETSCVCVCTKRVCVSNWEPKMCTVGIYRTYESRYLYSLGEYICLLLIVYLKISLIYHVAYYF